MTLLYKVKGDPNSKKSVRVEFDPPLAGYEEVKPRLLAMTADAQESLGMVLSPSLFTPIPLMPIHIITQTKSPQITDFHITRKALIPVPAILLLIYTTFAPRFIGPQWVFGQALHRTFGGDTVFAWIWVGLVTVHALEALYVQRLCVRHKTGFTVGVSEGFAYFPFNAYMNVFAFLRRNTSLRRYCLAAAC